MLPCAASAPASVPENLLRIALLEDDADLREGILLPGLRQLGWDMTGFATVAELYLRLPQESFDMLVLDVGLPDQDGFTVARYLRTTFPRLGIVMLTGRGSTGDRVRGLSLGADAYLAKPVDLDLLAATLHSLARRLDTGTIQQADGHRWQLHANGWSLVAPGGGSVTLTQAERCVLGLLLAHSGEAVSREALIAALTPDIYDFDPHRLETLVHRLRRKVAHGTRETLPLRTLHGLGYVMVA